MSAIAPARLTLGPLLFHWPAAKRRDFYLRIADEAPVDTVYLGEVVCSKRESAFDPYLDEAVRRLQAAGKTVVHSTLALVTTPREVRRLRESAEHGLLVEANDVACLDVLAGAPHVVGPYINVINERTRDVLASQGAIRIALPVELPEASIRTIAAGAGATAIEVQAFGRQPLSVAMRCYHARSHNLSKDHCQLVCGLDADGLTATSMAGEDVLTINGTQTLSYGYGVLLDEIERLRESGVGYFRLSPHDLDMVRVATRYRELLDRQREPAAVAAELRAMLAGRPLINGFVRGHAGMTWS
ncbi:MAG: U32 family peptidase [Gammaproteobacteria bacterium]|nr:U32 family peptidase [Gammaproteobacteria bacterium]